MHFSLLVAASETEEKGYQGHLHYHEVFWRQKCCKFPRC